MDWKKIKKIDGHVHLLPEESLVWKRQEDPACWGMAEEERFLAIMEEYHVEKAVLAPINDFGTYFDDPDKTNAWLGSMMGKHPDKFIAFADVVNAGGYFYEMAPYWLERAVKEFGLKGLKLHPSNLGMDIDCLDMVPVLRKAADLGVPVMVHSYPFGRQKYDCCEPAKIHNMAKIFPDVTFIISHMGGYRWMDALGGNEYVDISTFLPELVKLYGIEQANRILRNFGADRLVFATDFPQVYLCETGNIYQTYCDILDQMDFTKEECEKIAYGNMAGILGL